MNRLANERSPYLRHSAYQKIDWYPWGDEAFERAKNEDKPVFLSSGGVWCHWCHVMAKECFEDGEIAAFLNEHFISVKIDRDERPDIDRRYQQAVAAMGGGSGWPLSVFLTPDRMPFYGGTYFPPEDRQGRPGFARVLRSVSEFYREKKHDAAAYAARVYEALRPEVLTPGVLDPSMLAAAEEIMLSLFDHEHGGFGKAPKFPMPGVLEFLLRRAAAGSFAAKDALRTTLDRMADGGFFDQIGGGFHRYSVDEAWFVPHFEKMADDNAWLLRSYLDGYVFFAEEKYRKTAELIIAFVRETLSDPSGGFFASQDADLTPEDEGGYFTWTDEEFRRILSTEEYEILSMRFFHERGAMPHDPDKRVLCAARTISDIAKTSGETEQYVQDIIERGVEKLRAERNRRTAPFVDKTLYPSLNGMFITSFLKAYRVLGDRNLLDFAIMSLDRLLRENMRNNSLFRAENIPAMLEDYAYTIESCIAAYEATGDKNRLSLAAMLMDDCLVKFGDQSGGFFDAADDVLGMRLKRIEDIPHPSANAVMIFSLIKLWHITERPQYREAAEAALKIFAGDIRELSIHAGGYFVALDAWFGMLRLHVESLPYSELARAAMRLTGPSTTLVYGEDYGRVTPCRNETCFPPATSVSALLQHGTNMQLRPLNQSGK